MIHTSGSLWTELTPLWVSESRACVPICPFTGRLPEASIRMRFLLTQLFFALRAASLMSLQCTRRMERPSINTDLTEICVWIHSLWTQVVDSKFQRRGRHPIVQKSACPIILINSESVGMNRIRRLRQDGWFGTETPTVWVTYVPSRNQN